MEKENIHEFSKDAYDFFKLCGNQNAIKIRRILQITKDFGGSRFSELRILDLGCGPGIYSIEAALRGANVVAIDGRPDRMERARSICEKEGIFNVTFLQDDVRNISKEKLGEFDIIYCLGLLYHLDAADVFKVMAAVYTMCKRFIVIDTHIALEGKDTVLNSKIRYHGARVREHGDGDTYEKMISALASSIGNIHSFWFTKESLLRLLKEAGFTVVLECYIPYEPGGGKEKGDRITLVAVKGDPVKISSFPWLNKMSEEEIECKMRELGGWVPYWTASARPTQTRRWHKDIIKHVIKRVIGKHG